MKTYIFEGSLTAESPLATCSKDLKDREGGDATKPVPIPSTVTRDGKRLMFPATGIRGKLRRAARDLVRDAVIRKTGNDKPFSLEQHYLLTLGGIKSSGTSERSTVALEASFRRANPMISLFGAGDAGILGFVSGHLAVDNAICVNPCEADHQAQIFSGARSDDLYRDKTQVSFLSDADVTNLINQSDANKVRSQLSMEAKSLKAKAGKLRKEGASVEAQAEVKAQQDAIDLKLKVLAEEGNKDVSVGMPLAGFKAIPQGEVMNHGMKLLRSNEVELGLILKALNIFSLEPVIGAHVATGCGIVSGSYKVYEVTLQGRTQIGEVTLKPFDLALVQGEALLSAINTFEDFMLGEESDFSIPVKAVKTPNAVVQD